MRRALARALDAEEEIEVVGEADSSRQALARVPAVRPDVVLAGSRLHDPDSAELCRLLLDALPELHVLVVDVDADQKLVARMISAGASGMVSDTADEEDLVDAIETAAAGQMVMSAKTLMEILRRQHEAEPDPVDSLTPLERELFDLIGRGLSNTEIGIRLRLAPGTVRNYVSRLMRKLSVDRRAQLIALAVRREPD
ncbi:response regulator transcription factor [Intrasporangium mesophilum]